MKKSILAFPLMFMPIVASAGAVGDIFTAYANGLNMRCKITSSTTVMLYGEYSDNSGNDEQDYWVNEWSSCLVDYNKRTVDDDGNVLVCCSYQGSVSIPEKILNPNDGLFYVITRIGEYAFGHADGVTSVTLPSTITEICSHAFGFCFSLPSINLPETVTTIGDYAFYNSGLKSLDIPVGVKSIGKGAFRGCANLSSAVIPPDITEIEDFLFYDCSSLTEVTLGNAVTSIGRSSFGHTNLTSIVLPESVTTVDEYAFANCKSLTDVYSLPANIPTTQTNSFLSSDIGNATLHVPGALISYYKTIEPWSYFKKIVASDGPLENDGVYYNLNEETKTATVTYGHWDPNESKDGDGRYSGAIEIPASVVLDNISYSVTSIGRNAFAGCSGLTDVVIPSSVKTIEPNAFMDCASLTEIEIPNSVENLGVGLFIGCKNLKNATLPESITIIGNSMFAECCSLESFTVPDNVNTIDVAAFSQCTSLKSLNIGKSLTTIGGMAFTDCNNLSSLLINCSEIKNWFEGFTSIKDVIIGENVSAIGERAFMAALRLQRSLLERVLRQ